MRLLRNLTTLGLLSAMAWPAAAQTEAATQTTPTCFGRPATIVGTPGNDTIHEGTEVIVGLAGNDDLEGEYACGGKGSDELSGVLVSGGPDGDVLYATGSLILGGGGNDHFFDRRLFGAPHQVWRGNGGNDIYSEASGDDDFYGGAGNDKTDGGLGGSGADRLYGGVGDDYLNVVDADLPDEPDLVDGGAGIDTCIVDPDDEVINCETVTVIG